MPMRQLRHCLYREAAIGHQPMLRKTITYHRTLERNMARKSDISKAQSMLAADYGKHLMARIKEMRRQNEQTVTWRHGTFLMTATVPKRG
jgi:hypothetical protein